MKCEATVRACSETRQLSMRMSARDVRECLSLLGAPGTSPARARRAVAQLYIRAPPAGDPGESSLLEQLDQLDAMDVDTPFPFSALTTPVYSLSTNGATAGGLPSMNIVTFASPVSISPRAFAVGLYRDTLTWSNFLDTRTGVLQILRCKHLPLVELLGRTSGNDVDKLAGIKV